LQSLSELVSLARAEIKTADPNTKTTVNVSGWPLNVATLNRFERVFDAVAPHIDVVTLDLYADVDTLAHIPTFINAMKDRYKKPVVVGEYGVSTGDRQYSEADQATMDILMTDQIQRANPQAALVYEYDDEKQLAESNPHEAGFGVKENPLFKNILQRLSNRNK
jgi:arabinogalactan endo-1,4-beta-galactosidase